MTQLLTILPLSIIMIAGPQIITAVFLATSEHWRRNTVVLLGGAALSISLFVTAGFLIGGGTREVSDTVSRVLDVATIGLLVYAGIYVFLRRKKTEPPSWMGRLQSATPGLAFKLGFLLLGVFPSDLVTSLSVGRYLAREGRSLWDAVPFILLTLLLLAVPSAGDPAAGRTRAGAPAQAPSVDGRELVDHQRGGHRVLHRRRRRRVGPDHGVAIRRPDNGSRCVDEGDTGPTAQTAHDLRKRAGLA